LPKLADEHLVDRSLFREAHMTTYGTSYFVSFKHACRYYAPQEGLNWYAPELSAIIQRKIDEGGIHIGIPPMKAGDLISRIDGGTRYAITEKS
jgi:hypothetical protein